MSDFDDAEAEARLLVEANAAALGASDDDAGATPAEDVMVLLRINGPEKARQCGHISGPGVVYLHSAIRVHQCESCATSSETQQRIDSHRATVCDSCGERAAYFWPSQFTVTNVIVTAYICDDCRHGRRRAVLPEWTQRH